MIGDKTARTRSRTLVDESGSFTRSLLWSFYGSCTQQPVPQNPQNYSGEWWSSFHGETMSDWEVEGFKKLRKQGHIINNDMTKTTTYRDWLPGRKEVSVDVQYLGCSPQRWYDYARWSEIGNDSSKAVITTLLGSVPWLAEPVLSANELAALKELALTSAYARINASDVMALVSLAESEKTIVGLYTSFVRILRIISRVAKLSLRSPGYFAQNAKNKKRFIADTKDLANHAEKFYMEARYGLRPLYYDVMGLCKFLQGAKQTKDRLTFRGKQIWQRKSSDTVVKTMPISSGYYFKADVPFHRTTTKDVYVRAGVLTRFKDHGAIQGLGIDLIPETVWELVPFSFIVDWFINVGELIASWSPNYGFTTLTSWVTQETVVTKTIIAGIPTLTDLSTATRRCVGPQANYTYGGSETVIVKNRIAQPKRPVTPHFNVKLNMAKILDLAIIVKNLKGLSSLIKTLRV